MSDPRSEQEKYYARLNAQAEARERESREYERRCAEAIEREEREQADYERHDGDFAY